jgi:hypothetical protein
VGVSTKAHYGSKHFAIFPEDLIARIITFATEKGDGYLILLLEEEQLELYVHFLEETLQV